MPPEPHVLPDSVTLDSFSVLAPDNVPGGVLLQLQFKPDGEVAWQNTGDPVGASGVVYVDELEPCSWYWLRWLPLQ